MKEYTFDINGNCYNVVVNSMSGNAADVTVNGVSYKVGIRNNAIASVQEAQPAVVCQAAPVSAPQPAPVPQPGATPTAAPAPAATQSAAPAAGAGKTVNAPLPGVVIAIKVNVGDAVKAGQVVAVLEAMKMENDILAECAGTVTAINAAQGDSILEGAPIVTIG